MRRPARLTLGALPFELYPEGRVLVTLPATALPFGASIQATALYPSLAVFIDAMMPRMSRRVQDSAQEFPPAT